MNYQNKKIANKNIFAIPLLYIAFLIILGSNLYMHKKKRYHEGYAHYHPNLFYEIHDPLLKKMVYRTYVGALEFQR